MLLPRELDMMRRASDAIAAAKTEHSGGEAGKHGGKAKDGVSAQDELGAAREEGDTLAPRACATDITGYDTGGE